MPLNPRRCLITLSTGAAALLLPILFLAAADSPATPPARPASPIHLPTTMPTAGGYTAEDAFPGIKFRQPLAIASPPGEKDRLFIVEKIGTIQLLTNLSANPQKKLFMDLPAILTAHHQGEILEKSEWGLKSLAFHPDFAKNGFFFISYDFASPDPDGTTRSYNRLSRFSISKDNPNAPDPNSELPLITQVDLAPNHNAGDLHFGADGYLYYSMGDEGGADDHFDNARYIDKDFFAGIFRLDVDHRPDSIAPNPHHQESAQFPSAVNPNAYWIPADNPFINAKTHNDRPLDPAKIRTEFYCCGLRNPWRFCFDPATNMMMIADVGQGKIEELDIGAPGSDYGWSYKEGTHPGPRNRKAPTDVKWIDPIYEYDHGKGPYDGNCIIGGQFYRGSRLPELFGDYIFADYTMRHIWALKFRDGKWKARPLADGPDIAGMGIDPRDGDVLMCHFGGQRIERLARKDLRGDPPPALLSQTGAFSDLKTLTPAPGVIPYTPALSFWSDHAQKTRWFSLPTPADKITINPDGDFSFPTGTIFVKHFDLELRPGDPTSRTRLETRFLVKTPTGVYGITYRWRKDQSDADLVPETGADETFTITEGTHTRNQIWHYPSQSECLSCHTDIAGSVLGFNRQQLNTPAGEKNQFLTLIAAGYLTGDPGDLTKLPTLVSMTDTHASLDARVRCYLAVNCVMCHQPGGLQSSWDARLTSPNSTLLNAKLIDPKGDESRRLIVPGDPARSMLLQRLTANIPPRMPPLATNEIDDQARQLLTDYINSLPPAKLPEHSP